MSWNSGFDSSNYDSSGYGGGGGRTFDSHANQGGGFSYTQSQPGDVSGGGKLKRDQTITPLTIRQIQLGQFADGTLKVDGHVVVNGSIVGQLHTIKASTTAVAFQIDDGTGELSARMFVREDAMKSEGVDSLIDMAYVRLHGTVSESNGQRQFLARNAKKIVDYNEILFHQLEALHAHLALTQGPPPASGTQSHQPSSYSSNAMQAKSEYGVHGYINGGSQIRSGVPALGNGSSIDERKLVCAAFTTSAITGRSVHQVSADTGIDLARVRQLVVELTDEGLLYTTTQDEDHYKYIDD